MPFRAPSSTGSSGCSGSSKSGVLASSATVPEFFVDIPEAKELRLYDLADEYGKLAQQLSDHLERISPSFTAIAENWSGSIGAEQFFQSMQQHMDEVGSSIKAAGSMQEMVQQNAQNIETMKFMGRHGSGHAGLGRSTR